MKQLIGLLFIMGIYFSCNRKSAVVLENQTEHFSKELEFQLSNPTIESESIFFENENEIKIDLTLTGTTIRYTLNGEEPSLNSSKYSSPIILKESATLKAKAFHPQYKSSDVVTAQFVRLKEKIVLKNTTLHPSANEKYPGTGVEGLTDRKKGSLAFSAIEWMGFTGKDVEMIFELEEKSSVQKITTSFLSDQKSWIFLPESVAIAISDDGKIFKQIANSKVISTQENDPAQFYFSEIEFDSKSIRFIKVTLKPITAIPEWHPGKGAVPWLFVDEVIIE